MAAAANPNSSPKAAATTTGSPPWSKIVRGPEPEPETEPVTVQTNRVVENVTAESGGDNNVGEVKKMAWNTKAISTSNNGGKAESGGGSGGGGGGGGATDDEWPILSVGSKMTTTPKSSETFNNVRDFGSIKAPGIDTSSSTSVSSPMRSPLSTSQKMTTNNSNHHSTSNHSRPSRQRSMKRDGGSNPQANGVLPHQSSQSSGEGAHYHHHNHGSPRPTTPGSSLENSGRDNVQHNSNREPGQRNASGEHTHHRNPFRKGNGGPHSRGDGSHQNYGGRRSDQERGNQDLNHQRSLNGRDASMQPRGGSRPYVRQPPPVSAPFVYPGPMPPFMNPAIVPVFLHPTGMPLVPPIPPIYFSPPGPELYADLMKQIDFYFSDENLVRDLFLRGKMDENGWVSVDVISNFNRVKILTYDTYHILEAVRHSNVVEVQGDKMRRREDWRRWLLPPNVQFPISSGSQSPKGPISAVTDHIQSVSLDEKINYPNNVATLQASSRDSKNASADEANPKGC